MKHTNTLELNDFDCISFDEVAVQIIEYTDVDGTSLYFANLCGSIDLGLGNSFRITLDNTIMTNDFAECVDEAYTLALTLCTQVDDTFLWLDGETNDVISSHSFEEFYS